MICMKFDQKTKNNLKTFFKGFVRFFKDFFLGF